ncbi:hypothetical protein, partial [Lactococcus lactis]|uniref:hypothetical protein n=1 Tax=Lactococcus lactis TaxID=1358 RepID=UPI0021A3ADB0
ISEEFQEQIKKSKYFYLDKKSNFWGSHHSVRVLFYFFYNNVAKAITNIQMIVQVKLSSDLLDIIV